MLAAALVVAGCAAAPVGQPVDPSAVHERPAVAGFHGELHLPPGGGATARPAVLVVGGAEGGIMIDPLAAALARKGFPALAVAYFGLPDLPPTLSRIPLEYFAGALRTLATQPGVDPHRIVVWGVSRGSEVAQLLAVDFPDLVAGVVADSPSSVVHASSTSPDVAAWTLGGRDVAYTSVAHQDDPQAPGATVDGSAIDDAAIVGPILTICGDADRLWPSCAFADAIAARSPRVTRLVFPGAGHSFVGLYLQGAQAPGVAARSAAAGGTPDADTDAAIDAFDRAVGFIASV
ncbi:cytosolic acyl coenzyme A thioester hydrolase, inducible [Pseudonocardia sp. N23]|nr:cytosolic acyl coenzyme A thioester hydrolase, inducible [Pseudonocardia sp. N23]